MFKLHFVEVNACNTFFHETICFRFHLQNAQSLAYTSICILIFPRYNTSDSLEWGREGKEGVGQEVKGMEKSRDETGDKGI
jgi:hypothetical protein